MINSHRSEVDEAVRQAEELLRTQPEVGDYSQDEGRIDENGVEGIIGRNWYNDATFAHVQKLVHALDAALRNEALLGPQASHLANTVQTLRDWDRAERAVAVGRQIGLNSKLFAIRPKEAKEFRVRSAAWNWKVVSLDSDPTAIPLEGLQATSRWVEALKEAGEQPDAIYIGHEVPKPRPRPEPRPRLCPNVVGMFGPFAVECYRWSSSSRRRPWWQGG